MEDAITANIARKRLEAIIEGCVTGDMSPDEIHRVILEVLYQADIPLPPVADGPCVRCESWQFAYSPQGWQTLREERCPSCGLHRW